MSLTLPEDPEYCTGNVDSQSQGGNKNELRKTCHRTDLFSNEHQNTMTLYCWGGLCDSTESTVQTWKGPSGRDGQYYVLKARFMQYEARRGAALHQKYRPAPPRRLPIAAGCVNWTYNTYMRRCVTGCTTGFS